MPTSALHPFFDASVLHSGTTNWTTSVGANGTAIDTTGAVLLQQAVFGGNLWKKKKKEGVLDNDL